MLEKLIESNKKDILKNLEDFREGFENELKKEKEVLNEKYKHEIELKVENHKFYFFYHNIFQ